MEPPIATGVADGGLDTRLSYELHMRARRVMPMGVSGEGQFYPPYPIAFASATGKWLTDLDGNRYLDYHAGFGTAVLGYSQPEVSAAVERATREGGTFVGLPHVGALDLAERICSLIPCAESVAFSGGGGSDSIYHAVRLARSVTGCTKVVKVEGGYHGWHSDVAVSVRPPLPIVSDAVEPIPVSSGSLPAVTAEVVVVEVNDVGGLEAAFRDHAGEIAAAIIEPVLYSAGCILVDDLFMSRLRELCDTSGSLLIFDEIMTGFRNGLAGAGARSGVVPDVAVFGKAIANGYILSALTGRRELLAQLTPSGPVLFSGTFNAHPLSVAAALTTLDILERDEVPDRLDRLTRRLVDAVNRDIARLGISAVCQGHASVWSLYFLTDGVSRYREVRGRDADVAGRLTREFFQFMRERGIYAHQRLFIRCFISAQHDENDIDRTVEAVGEFLESRADELSLERPEARAR